MKVVRCKNRPDSEPWGICTHPGPHDFEEIEVLTEGEVRERMLGDDAVRAVERRWHSVPYGQRKHAHVEIRADMQAALDSAFDKEADHA